MTGTARWWPWLVVILLFVGGGMASAQWAVELEGRYWQSELDGLVRVSEGGLGTDVSLKDDLAMPDENFPEYRLTFRTGQRSRTRLAYTSVSFGGDATVTRTIEFSGQTYTVGTRVVSALDLKYGRLGWAWDLVKTDNDAFVFSAIFDVKHIALKADLAAPDLLPPVTETEEASATLPAIGVGFEVSPTPAVVFFAEATGVSSSKYGSLFDGEAGIRLVLFRQLSLVASYRVFDIDYEDEPDFADFRLSGPFFGAGVRF